MANVVVLPVSSNLPPPKHPEGLVRHRGVAIPEVISSGSAGARALHYQSTSSREKGPPGLACPAPQSHTNLVGWGQTVLRKMGL